MDIIEDADPAIDGRTSGHHAEIRDILTCAANGVPVGECLAGIYLDEGELKFDLVARIFSLAE